MAEAKLQGQARTDKGKQAAKHFRQQGLIPGILYGPGETPSPLLFIHKEFVTLLHSYGRNVVVDLSVGDDKKRVKAFIYEIQHDPISGEIIHVDLKHISLKEKIHTTVPVQIVGVPVGVKNEGGILEHIMHSLEIACLPADIPDGVSIDVSDLHTGAIIHVKDLPHQNFDFLSDPETSVVQIVSPRVTVEAAVEETEAEEPEVIGVKKEQV